MPDIQDRYLDLEGARNLLEKMGIPVSRKQLYRAVEPDAKGRRKLPFFKDPINGRLRIAESRLLAAYGKAQIDAEKSP